MVCWHIGEARAFKIRRVCSGYAKSMEGKKRAKWVRKLGGREEDKGGDLLPKLLLTPLPPALCLSAPSLLWVLSKDKDGRYHNRIMSQREVTVSRESESKRWVERGGRDLQTQWSERFRLETMRTFLVTFEMGIAQHTTRGEDRPLLSPIGGRREGCVWRGGGRGRG